MDFKESKYFSLTPQKKADGSWKSKKKKYILLNSYNYNDAKYLSASNAAIQPVPAAVIACL
jgi:hypothetical protein